MIEQRIVNIISNTLKIPAETIKQEDKLIELVTDSIKLFELLIQFEKELGRSIDYDEIAHIEDVGHIVEYAKKVMVV